MWAEIFRDFLGLLLSEGELWKEQRRFALTSLRNLGMGKGWLEEAILAEVAGAIQAFQNAGPAPYDPRPHLQLSVSNVICALVFGERFEHTDKKFIRLCGLFGENVRLTSQLFPILAFPWLKRLPFGKLRLAWEQFCQNLVEVKTFSQGLIDEHRVKQATIAEEKEDFINGFLAEQADQIRQFGSERHFKGAPYV